MSLPGILPYLPGHPPSKPEPLARYLPPLPEGIATRWLNIHDPKTTNQGIKSDAGGNWLLDPFGTSPGLAVEMARSGYRVLVAANNPVSRFLLEMAANPPSEEELRSVLADLAAAHKGDERIEPHIRDLYRTECNECGREIEAQAFLWERNPISDTGIETSPTLFARIYQCPYCGQSGEYPARQADLERASQFSLSGLHRARALERVVAHDDPDRQHVEEALSTYTPRALYAIFTLINKLEGIELTSTRRYQLDSLLLTALDAANSLWSYPSARSRPKSLKARPRFRENNIWLAIEEGIPLWASPKPAVPLVIWPDHPPKTGGISLYEGRLKDLSGSIGDIDLVAVITALPRPNQAFWTLSALWAGWLWGREAVGPFKSVLHRRRYDWTWHTLALHAAFEILQTILSDGSLFFALVGEAEPGFLNSALLGAEAAGFELNGIALQSESEQAQITWKIAKPKKTPLPAAITSESAIKAQRAIQEYLMIRGEPANYLQVHAAGLFALAQTHQFPRPTTSLAEVAGQINPILEDALSYHGGFQRFEGSEKSLEVGFWWLGQTTEQPVPLSDRLEMELVRYIIKHPGSELLEIAASLYQAFPGLLTPNSELIQICLESYAEPDPNGGGWQIRKTDLPQNRRADLEQITQLLKHLGQNMDYQVIEQTPLLWLDRTGELRYACYVIASAVISELILSARYPGEKSLLILPGGRANLVTYKIDHDPRLNQAIEKGWRFIKFRQVRWLADNPVTNEESLLQQLAQDPLTYDVPQLRLF